ncbi:copper resistance CopC family protein [Nitrospira sp. Nam74]
MLTTTARLFLIATLGMSTAHVGAHAVLMQSSLEDHTLRVNQPTELLLSFNSRIELGLSRVFLVSKGDVYTPVEIAKGHKAGQMIIKVPALEEGDYALKYKVFASDGHLTEDVIRFKVSRGR